jgi:sulfide:quinone oxidoreductase
LSADEPLAVGRTRRVALGSAAGAANAGFLADTITAVDPQRMRMTAAGGDQLAYDALVLAVGAEPVPTLEHALAWDDRAEAELLGGLLRGVEEGYSCRVAVVIPPGPGWPLRG